MNSKRKTKLIVVVGPTASGKSELAVQIAKKIGGEIISADSRQVYRGLDIGTGKVTGKWQSANGKAQYADKKRFAIRDLRSAVFMYKNIPHYCIDFVDPKKQYSAAEFKTCAKRAIDDTARRGKTPIIAGGTGFWIDAVVYDMHLPEVPPNEALRKKLAKKSAAELFLLLKKLDPERAKTIEQKNPRRIIRAIEIARALGKVPSINKKSPYQAFWIGIRPKPEVLKRRIKKRLISRMRAGMIEEARKLRRHGLPWKRFYELGLEYRFLADFLRKKITKEQLFQKIEQENNDYAKRQITWFKRNKNIIWVDDVRKGETIVMRASAKE